MDTSKALNDDGATSQMSGLQSSMLATASLSVVLVSHHNPWGLLGLRTHHTKYIHSCCLHRVSSLQSLSPSTPRHHTISAWEHTTQNTCTAVVCTGSDLYSPCLLVHPATTLSRPEDRCTVAQHKMCCFFLFSFLMFVGENCTSVPPPTQVFFLIYFVIIRSILYIWMLVHYFTQIQQNQSEEMFCHVETITVPM